MQKGLIFFFAQVFLLFTTESYSCICDNFRPMEEYIKSHAFIAHVKIVGKAVKNDTTLADNKMRVRFAHEGDLAFEIIELFKGDSLKSIKEYDIRTSCEIGVQEGEEWIIFAWYNPETKLYSIGGCSPSRRIKNINGERGEDWAWGRYESTLIYLKKYFEHFPYEVKYECGVYRNYYSNGNIEWEAEYADNKLHGNRKIFFANGILWEDENYKEGKKNGVQKRYARSGQLLADNDYLAGEINHSVYWYDTSYFQRRMRMPLELLTLDKRRIDSALSALTVNPATIQKETESYHDLATGYYYSRKYTWNGTLEQESFAYHPNEIRVTCRYNDAGKLLFEGVYIKANDHTVEKTWDETGKLISHKVWVKGKYLGNKLAE